MITYPVTNYPWQIFQCIICPEMINYCWRNFSFSRYFSNEWIERVTIIKVYPSLSVTCIWIYWKIIAIVTSKYYMVGCFKVVRNIWSKFTYKSSCIRVSNPIYSTNRYRFFTAYINSNSTYLLCIIYSGNFREFVRLEKILHINWKSVPSNLFMYCMIYIKTIYAKAIITGKPNLRNNIDIN